MIRDPGQKLRRMQVSVNADECKWPCLVCEARDGGNHRVAAEILVEKGSMTLA